MIVSVFVFSLVLCVCSSLSTSKCNFTSSSTQISVDEIVQLYFNCSITSIDTASFKGYVSAPVSVKSDSLPTCTKSSCEVNALNVSNDDIFLQPHADVVINSSQIIYFFNINESSTSFEIFFKFNVFVGSLFLNHSSLIDVELTISDSTSNVTENLQLQYNGPTNTITSSLDSSRLLLYGVMLDIENTVNIPASYIAPSTYRIVSSFPLQIHPITSLNNLSSTITLQSFSNFPCHNYMFCDGSSSDLLPLFVYDLDWTACCSARDTDIPLATSFYMREYPRDNGVIYGYFIFPNGYPVLTYATNILTYSRTVPGVQLRKFGKKSSSGGIEKYILTVAVENVSPYTLYNPYIVDDYSLLQISDISDGFAKTNGTYLTYVSILERFSVNTNFSLGYTVSLIGLGTSFPAEAVFRNAQFSFTLLSRRQMIFNGGYEGVSFLYQTCSTCFEKDITYILSVADRFEYIIVALLFSILIGFIVMCLIIICCAFCKMYDCMLGSVSPFVEDDKRDPVRRFRHIEREKRRQQRLKNKQSNINKIKPYALQSNEAMSDALNNNQKLSPATTQKSLVSIMDMNRTLAEKQLQWQDIAESIQWDQSAENSRVELMKASFRNLLTYTVEKHYTAQSIVDRVGKQFERSVADFEATASTELKNNETRVRNECQKSNEEKLMTLAEQQKTERTATVQKLKNEPISKLERYYYLSRLDSLYKSDTDELSSLLETEKMEKVEKTRARYFLSRRLAVKEQAMNALNTMKEDPSFDQDAWDDILRQYLESTVLVDKQTDEALSQQRMLLYEKLAKRKAHLAQKELASEYYDNALNSMIEKQTLFINGLVMSGQIDKRTESNILSQLKSDMLHLSQTIDNVKKKQMITINEKIEQKKRARHKELDDDEAKEINEIDALAFDALKNDKIYGYSALEEYVSNRFTAVGRRRVLKTNVDLELDTDAADDIARNEGDMFDRTVDAMQDSIRSLCKSLADNGVTDADADRLVNQFSRDRDRAKEALEDEKERQQLKFKKKIEKAKRQWREHHNQELQEQSEIRHYEDEMAQSLISSQLSITPEERERIINEHQKNVASLENSLSISKLHKQRLVEERLYERKQKKLNQLKIKQEEEQKELDDQYYPSNESQSELINRHLDERAAKGTQTKKRLMSEYDRVNEEMQKERATALATQEEAVSTLMASLQIEKAKQLAQIEEQHKQLINLKLSLISDMNERGRINELEAKKLLDSHVKTRSQLELKLRDDRIRQTDAMQQKLEQRMKNRNELQGRKMSAAIITDDLSKQNQLKLATMEINHNRDIEFEKFRLEREKTQVIESVKEGYELKTLEAVRNQELALLSDVVKGSDVEPGELLAVLMVLMPNRPLSELQQIVSSLTKDSAKTKKQDSLDDPDSGKILPKKGNFEMKVRHKVISELSEKNAKRWRKAKRVLSAFN